MKCGETLPKPEPQPPPPPAPKAQAPTSHHACAICNEEVSKKKVRLLRNQKMVRHIDRDHVADRFEEAGLVPSAAGFAELARSMGDTLWHLCPRCHSIALGLRVTPPRPAPEPTSRRPRPKPAPVGFFGVVFIILQRIVALFLVLIFLSVAVEELGNALDTPMMFNGVIYVPWNLAQRATDAVVGMGALGAFLLAVNILVASRRGKGPIDWLFSVWDRKTPGWMGWPVTVPRWVVLVAGFVTVVMGTSNFKFYLDPEEAVSAYEEHEIDFQLSNSGRLLFAVDEESTSHVAWITPDLVRTLVARGMDVHPFRQEPNELPFPSVLPFILAGVLALILSKFSASSTGGDRAVCFWAGIWIFGLLNLYVMLWMVTGLTGFSMLGGGIHPEWLTSMMLAAIVWIIWINGTAKRSELWRGQPGIAMGWLGLFFGSCVVTQILIMSQSNSTSGSPAYLWMFAWIVMTGITWRCAVPERG